MLKEERHKGDSIFALRLRFCPRSAREGDSLFLSLSFLSLSFMVHSLHSSEMPILACICQEDLNVWVEGGRKNGKIELRPILSLLLRYTTRARMTNLTLNDTWTPSFRRAFVSMGLAASFFLL